MTAKLTPPFESINAEYCVNHEMLMLQRIDLFPMEEFAARHLLNQHFSKEQVSNIQMLLPPIRESPCTC
jgi:hypothetical protein